jgi:xanthine phosphoribosyltransferase
MFFAEAAMQVLKERILKDGRCVGDDILKVDSFLNHQIDTSLVDLIGLEFAERFSMSGATKILTIEASGIPVAYAAARAMGNLPLIFAKKGEPSTMVETCYTVSVNSFTKGTVSNIRVSKEFIGPGDKILLIDDFLAHGEAAVGLLSICRQAGAECVGMGVVIEKKYQGGGARLREMGLRVESLALISSLRGGKIEFT